MLRIRCSRGERLRNGAVDRREGFTLCGIVRRLLHWRRSRPRSVRVCPHSGGEARASSRTAARRTRGLTTSWVPPRSERDVLGARVVRERRRTVHDEVRRVARPLLCEQRVLLRAPRGWHLKRSLRATADAGRPLPRQPVGRSPLPESAYRNQSNVQPLPARGAAGSSGVSSLRRLSALMS